MKKFIVVAALAGLALFISNKDKSVAKPVTGPLIMPDFKNKTRGIVARFENDDVMLICEDGNAIILSGNMNFSGLENGDELTIYYDDLEETYPSRTIVKEMMLNSKGDVSRISRDVLDKLKDLGWTIKS